MPLGERATSILEHILETGHHEIFPILADEVEENGMPVLAKVLRQHYKNHHWPAQPDYLPDDEGLSAKESLDHIRRSPQLIPGVYMVPGHDRVPGNPKNIGYWLHDLREFQKPDYEDLYEQGADDTADEYTQRDIHDWLHENPPVAYFHSHNDYNAGTHDAPRYRIKRDTLDLAKPIKPYVPPGKPIHITGLSKGGNCTHCGKQEIHRIHIKDPETGEECQIGSTCAHENLVGMGGQKPTQKKLLHLAAVAQQHGHEVKDFRLASEKHSIKGLRGKTELARVDPDYHSQQEVYAALVAEGVDPTEAERLSHALS